MDIAEISSSSALKKPVPVQTGTAATTDTGAAEETTVESTVRALDAFREELRSNLRARFFTRFSPEPSLTQFAPPASAEDVANEALATARDVANDSPVRAAKSLITFRANVQETAEVVRASLGNRPDVRDIDNVVALVNRGVDQLQAANESSAQSTASILSVDSRTAQKSTILIRTQDGDEVGIQLRNIEGLRIRDAAISDEAGSASSTRVVLNQERDLQLSVEGELDDGERAAIQNVVARAAEIADDFFGGDLSAAFANAEAFEFDTSELQRVKLRFRLDQQSRITYAEASQPAPVAVPVPSVIDAPAAVPAPVPKFDLATPVPVIGIKPTEDLEPIINRPQPVGEPIEIKAPEASADIDPVPVAAETDEVASPAEEAADTAAEPATALGEFFNFVSDFLRATTEGFQQNGAESTQLFFSERFKLTLLREALITAAPAAESDAAETAADVIDKLAAATSSE